MVVGLSLLVLLFWCLLFKRRCCDVKAPIGYHVSSAGAAQANGIYLLIGCFEGGPVYLHETEDLVVIGFFDRESMKRTWRISEMPKTLASVKALYSVAGDRSIAPPTSGWAKGTGPEPPPVVAEHGTAEALSAQRAAYATERVASTRKHLRAFAAQRRGEYARQLARQREQKQIERSRLAERQARSAEQVAARDRAYHRSILPAAAPRV
jgi:hypothetical protein